MEDTKKTRNTKESDSKNFKTVFNIISIIVSIILIPIIVISGTMFYKSVTNPSEPADFMGNIPIVMKSGDLGIGVSVFDDNSLIIFDKVKEGTEFKVGDIISYWKDRTIVVQTIRDIEVDEEIGTIYIVGNPDDNDNNYRLKDPSKIIGTYKTHINDVGSIILFISTPIGIICLAAPLVAMFLVFNILDKKKYKKALEEAINKNEGQMSN